MRLGSSPAISGSTDYGGARSRKVNAFAGPFGQARISPEQHLFITERVGFVITGDWFLNSLAKAAPELDYGITVMPVPEEGAESATWAGGWSAGHPQGAKNSRRRVEFIQYFAGEPGQRTYTTETAHLPTIRALARGRQSLEDRNHCSSPSSCCRPRRTDHRCRWEPAIGTS